MASPQSTAGDRFHDQEIVFSDGTSGTNITIPSASPLNYHQVLNEPDLMPKIDIDGKLFLPREGREPLPVVIVLPGSLGVAPSHLAHAETLKRAGFATFVLDSFGARQVSSTVADQTQFSFAASAYDVLAAFRVLSAIPELDASRIGAQGHSRGGSAVLTAATRRFADAVLGTDSGLAAVYAAYPWSGQQFLDPRVGHTRVRVIMGDRDEWCSPMQAQGHCQAMRLCGAAATFRLVGGAQHSFDRGTEVVQVAEASVSPAAPTVYIDDDGSMIHPLDGVPDSKLVDRDLMVYALKAGFGRKGARIGSGEGEARIFREDMLDFWRSIL